MEVGMNTEHAMKSDNDRGIASFLCAMDARAPQEIKNRIWDEAEAARLEEARKRIMGSRISPMQRLARVAVCLTFASFILGLVVGLLVGHK
jgi:hypothetical protein